MSLRDYLFDARKRGYLLFKQSFLGLINCGALSIIKDTTTGIDSVGKSTRDSIRPKYFNGDGVWYGSFGLNNEPLSYIDHTTGLTVNTSTDGSGNFIFTTNGVRTLTINGKIFTPNEISDPTTQTNVMSTDGTAQMQAFLAPADWVSDSIYSVNDLNQYGWTNADGTTIYKDEALTQLYDASQPIQALQLDENTFSTSFCKGWISDGAGGSVYGLLEHKGQIKRNTRVVDGVVDNGVDYGNWNVPSNPSSIETSENGVELTFDNERHVINIDNLPNCKPSTIYTIVFNVTKNTIDDFIRTGATSQTVLESGVEVMPQGSIGEFRTLVQTRADLTGRNSISIITNSLNVTGEVDYTFNMYEGDYATGNPPLPETGKAVDGNSIMLTDSNGTIYPAIAKADTANTWHNDYTLDTPTPKVVQISSLANVTNNQTFFSSELNKLMFFDESLSGDCLVKANQYMGFNEPLLDSNGEYILDSNGEQLYVYKEGVTRS